MTNYSIERLQKLVGVIRAAAMAGDVCPTNDAVVGKFELRSPSAASEMIRGAERAGLIVVQRGISSRVVSAPDGSWRTAGFVSPHSEAAAKRAHTPGTRTTRRRERWQATPPRLGGRPPGELRGPLPPVLREPPLVLAPRAPGHTCLWPMWGHEGRPTGIFCDAPRDGGRLPYCAKHHTLAVRPKGDAA